MIKINCNCCSNSFKDKSEDGWIVTRAKTKESISSISIDDGDDDDDDGDDDNDDDETGTVLVGNTPESQGHLGSKKIQRPASSWALTPENIQREEANRHKVLIYFEELIKN